MKIIHRDVQAMTKMEYRACYRANFGPGGYMRAELIGCRSGNGGRTGQAIMLWDGPPDSTSSLKGWVLVTPVRNWGEVWASPWNRKKAKVTVQFFIKSKYRKQGLAQKLMKEVQKVDPCPHVFPHSNASGRFFSKYNVTAAAVDRHWIRKAKSA